MLLLLFSSILRSPKNIFALLISKLDGVILKLFVKIGVYSTSLEVIFNLMS